MANINEGSLGTKNMELSLTDYSVVPTDETEEGSKPVRPVDLVHLARQTMGDRTLECEILGLFKHQSLTHLERMKSAASVENWSAAAHVLKGSAKAIGAWSVADLAQQAEQLSATDFEQHRDRTYDALRDKVMVANNYIALLLKSE